MDLPDRAERLCENTGDGSNLSRALGRRRYKREGSLEMSMQLSRSTTVDFYSGRFGLRAQHSLVINFDILVFACQQHCARDEHDQIRVNANDPLTRLCIRSCT